MFLQVVAAVIRGHQDTVLISKRKKDSHQGGLWEFPGGKVEIGETPLEALKREINEELGIVVRHARPLIKVHHHYSDKSVCLDVWEVGAFDEGEFQWNEAQRTAVGKEGQPVEWVKVDNLNAREFPAANYPILSAVMLPSSYCITPNFSAANPSNEELNTFFHCLRKTILSGSTLIQLRAPILNHKTFISVAKEALTHCRELDAKLVINGKLSLQDQIEADGFHLSSRQLMSSISPRVLSDSWLGASCHSVSELKQAELLGCNYASLSPVLPTSSHPHSSPMGWGAFSQFVQDANLPVYALGGLSDKDLGAAWRNGGQGVAGIGAFWKR